MSTLDELRTTLEDHAGAVRDDGLHRRAADVRLRGRRVRRQRRAGVSVAAVAVLAATVIVTQPDSMPTAPADRELLGMQAPATMTSLGYTYAFDRGIVGSTDRTVVKLPDSDRSRLLTWADRGVGRIHVLTPDGEDLVTRGDFEDFLVIPPGAGGTWSVEGADTAAAIYQVDGTRPPEGVTRGGVTFRDTVLDRHLVDAAVGAAGQSTVRGTIDLPSGRVGVATFCTGGTHKTWLHVQVSGAFESFGTSCAGPVFDPGGAIENEFHSSADGPTHVRMWATEGEHGPPSTAPGLRMGYGFYSLSRDTLRVAGVEVDQQVEYAGHVWGMPRTIESEPGQRRFHWPSPEVTPTTLVVAAFSHTGGPVYTSLAGESGAAYAGVGLGSSATLGVLGAGQPDATLRIGGTPSARALLGLAFYARLG